MENDNIFVIDFDSTFVRVESLDLLAAILVKRRADLADVPKKIHEITDLAMSGKLSFELALKERLALLECSKEDLKLLIQQLKEQVSASISRNKEFFKRHAEQIYIISGGFKEFIIPVVKEYGIREEHVFANTFLYNYDGLIQGFDQTNPLAKARGKVNLMRELAFTSKVYMIGDGYTDYEVRESLCCDAFVAFTENVSRKEVVEKADFVVSDFDAFLEKLAYSSPKKKKTKVLLLENINKKAKEYFTNQGCEVELIESALSEKDLIEKIRDVHFVGLRSKTQLTKEVLSSAKELIAVGAFCIGTNQIDLATCVQKGIAVFNAPFSNSRSVVELAIANLIFLMRNLGSGLVDIQKGKWSKSSNQSYEIRNKVLGIVGYGNIGEQLSVLAEAIGMQVLFYDLEEKRALGNAKSVSNLHELLQASDAVSLHVDGRKENANLIGSEELRQMKQSAVLINLSRGDVVDVSALKEALLEKRINGAAVDVFPEEPQNNEVPFSSPLMNLPNTLLTSHIGGSTVEAQVSIAKFVPEKAMRFIRTGNSFSNLSLPRLQIKPIADAVHFAHIHENIPGMLAAVNDILAKYKINILSQSLKTKGEIGYMLTAVNKDYDQRILKELEEIPHTIRFRLLG